MFLQSLSESGYNLRVTTESHHVPPNHPSWVSGTRPTSWLSTGGRGKDYYHDRSGRGRRGHVAMGWGPIAVVGMYLSPAGSLAQYEDLLASSSCERPTPTLVLLYRDFNA
ncbi:hypothetical protein KM043_000126 [Ampulex compressa]|nr:hypothetical protein KM043_000126 [Ampulex compressa]